MAFRYALALSLLVAAASADFTSSTSGHGNPTSGDSSSTLIDTNASPKQGWASGPVTVNEPGFVFGAETGFYPPTASDPYLYGSNDLGFSLSGLLSTGLSILAGVFMLTFALTFLRNFLASNLVQDLFDGRSMDVDTVAEISGMIMEAYQKFSN